MSENQDRPTYGQEYGGANAGSYGSGGGGQEYRAGSEYGQNPYGQDPYGGPQGQPGAPGQQPQQWQQPQQGAFPPPPGGPGWNGSGGQQWGPQQQWGQPGQQWGQPGQQWGGPVQEPVRPTSITVAFWLIIAAAVVMVGSTLAGAFALTTPEGKAIVEDVTRQQVEASGLTGTEAEQMMQTTVDMMPGFMTAFALVALVLYLLVAFKIRSGSRPARIVGTVLAALSLLMMLTSLLGGMPGLEIVWVLLGVGGIVMAYRPDSTEYMRQRAWAKSMRVK
ncbi:hypothetical protein [Micrococcus lylae]|uniref:Uncharacterized protein n=1 Tax=Micrococcus lylae TaxID=1273 RepID=A0ABY2JZ02_9MICC|nr:hypothetical protein [Micrococcus lylae]TFH98945.1 hypothetical protein E4A49_06985 [Micrococcus lylae]